jgi:hypothetical protein
MIDINVFMCRTSRTSGQNVTPHRKILAWGRAVKSSGFTGRLLQPWKNTQLSERPDGAVEESNKHSEIVFIDCVPCYNDWSRWFVISSLPRIWSPSKKPKLGCEKYVFAASHTQLEMLLGWLLYNSWEKHVMILIEVLWDPPPPDSFGGQHGPCSCCPYCDTVVQE